MILHFEITRLRAVSTKSAFVRGALFVATESRSFLLRPLFFSESPNTKHLSRFCGRVRLKLLVAFEAEEETVRKAVTPTTTLSTIPSPWCPMRTRYWQIT